MRKINVAALGLLLAASLAFGGGKKEANASGVRVVKVGVVGEYNAMWEPINQKLAADNIRVELVKFTEYVQPNLALDAGDIDMNGFQTRSFLNNEKSVKGYKIIELGNTIVAPLGLYSLKIKAISDLKNGDQIAIASDKSSQGRALKMLEKAGLLTINPAAGAEPDIVDITANPRGLRFTPVEAAQTPRLMQDVTASFINGGHALSAGLNPAKDAVLLEIQSSSSDNPYINVLAARIADKDDPVYRKVVEAYQTEQVRAILESEYKGALIPAW
jgi:D-methionine transport system substrate-binding protein